MNNLKKILLFTLTDGKRGVRHLSSRKIKSGKSNSQSITNARKGEGGGAFRGYKFNPLMPYEPAYCNSFHMQMSKRGYY